MRTLARFALTVLAAGLGLVAGIVALAPAARALLGAGRDRGPSSVAALTTDLPERSTVYADDGTTVLAVLHADDNRTLVSYAQIPKVVVAAVVDTEDDRFWSHHGVNFQATLRAALRDAQGGQVTQGGSTITQQLIKNTVLTSERTVSRKLKEAVLAWRLEGELSKQQILERYLNTIYFGNGAYGIQAAAETYFGVPVEQLTTVQGAFLAGVIRNPDGYDPFRYPAQSRARRNFVLSRMVARKDLSAADAARLSHEPLPLVRVQSIQPDSTDGYFVEEVKQRLLEDPQLGPTAQARYNALFRGGLQIYTSLDPSMQEAARLAVENDLPTEGGKWTTALVAVDPQTGAVRALIGGPGFSQSQYRIATEGVGRQPGSSFKPIVLATALSEGYEPYAGVDGSSPCSFYEGNGKYYTPENDEGQNIGYTNITNATAYSVNCAYVRLAIDAGLSKVTDMAKLLGVTSPLSPLPSMAIGSEEVRPIDMAGVYATFAADGVHHTPFLVQRVLDRSGKLVLTGGDKGTAVLSPQKAREETQILRSVVQYGTGTVANLAGRQVAGKTGTSDHNGNAWFDGYTPQLATVVWMGSPAGNVPMTSVGGPTASGRYQYQRTVFGGTYPALIWHDFMTAALAGQPSVPFVLPDPSELGSVWTVRSPFNAFSGSGPGATPGYGSGYGPPSGRAPVPRGRGTTTVPAAPGPSTTAGGTPPPTIGGPPPTGPPPTAPPASPPPTAPVPTAGPAGSPP